MEATADKEKKSIFSALIEKMPLFSLVNRITTVSMHPTLSGLKNLGDIHIPNYLVFTLRYESVP